MSAEPRKNEVTRDTLEEGDAVEVVTRWGSGGSAQERWRSGRVKSVVRAAARVKFDDDGTFALVRFNHMRRLPKPDRMLVIEAPQRPATVTPIAAAVPVPVAAAPVTEPKRAEDEIDAWLNMGRELLAPIESELSMLRATNEALEAEKHAIDVELEANATRMKALHDKRSAITKVTDAVGRVG